MEKLNKPYLQELASKQRDSNNQLTEQLAALSTSKDSAEEKLKQFISILFYMGCFFVIINIITNKMNGSWNNSSNRSKLKILVLLNKRVFTFSQFQL